MIDFKNALIKIENKKIEKEEKSLVLKNLKLKQILDSSKMSKLFDFLKSHSLTQHLKNLFFASTPKLILEFHTLNLGK